VVTAPDDTTVAYANQDDIRGFRDALGATATATTTTTATTTAIALQPAA